MDALCTKLLIINFFIFFALSFYANAQNTLTGYIADQDKFPIEGVSVILDNNRNLYQFYSTSDKNGNFRIDSIPNGTYIAYFKHPEYKFYKKHLKIYENRNSNLGFIFLNQLEEFIYEGEEYLHSSSKNLFTRNSIELNTYRFNNRGLDQYSTLSINGIPLKDFKSARNNFTPLIALSDLNYYKQESLVEGQVSEHNFAPLSFSDNYDLNNPIIKRKISFNYSFDNKNYNLNKVKFSYHSGLFPSKFYFSTIFSKRWAESGPRKSSFYDSYTYFFSLGKIFSKHKVNLSIISIPYLNQSLHSSNTQEIYNLAGYQYNPNWGFQNGKVRNSNIKKYNDFMFLLSENWKLSINEELSFSFLYSSQKTNYSSLSWYKSPNPSPIFYKNLPSWYSFKNNNYLYELIKDQWINKENIQINWDNLYYINSKLNSSKTAFYYLVHDVQIDYLYHLKFHWKKQFNNFKFNYTFDHQNYIFKNYKKPIDLLGADFVINRNPFSDKKFNTLKSELTSKGEKIEYDYKLYRNSINNNLNFSFHLNPFYFMLSSTISYSSSQRKGFFQHADFPLHSFGKSNSIKHWSGGGKMNISYRWNRNLAENQLEGAFIYYSQAPFLKDIYINPKVYDYSVPNLNNKHISSINLRYYYKQKKIETEISTYYTLISGETENKQYFTENLLFLDNNSSSSYSISEILKDVKKEYLGIELSFEWKLNQLLTFYASSSFGQYIYKNNPRLLIFSENLLEYKDYGKTFLKNYKISGTPQSACLIGIKYRFNKNQWIRLTMDYLFDNYMLINPLRRTSNWFLNYQTGLLYNDASKNIFNLLKQNKFDNTFLFNLYVGKNIQIKRGFITINFSINNIFNKRFIYSGYENGRLSYPDFLKSYNDSKIFDSHLTYNLGRIYSFYLGIKI